MSKVTIYEAPARTEYPTHPGIFLAGPILGTWMWQNEAAEIIQTHYKGSSPVSIFNPRRQSFTKLEDFSPSTFKEQVDWEHYHLDLAKSHGIVMFWLANKTQDMPHRNYALTTLFELGEFYLSRGKRVVVGIEPGFTNEQYIRYTFSKKADWIPVFSNLEEMCKYVAERLT